MNDFQCSCCGGGGLPPHSHDTTSLAASDDASTTMSLHSEIQHENVKTYNSTNEASGKAILKEYTERYTAEPDCLEDWDSDCDDDRGDEEMEDSEWGVILFIPFQTGCKIVSVSVMTVDSATE